MVIVVCVVLGTNRSAIAGDSNRPQLLYQPQRQQQLVAAKK